MDICTLLGGTGREWLRYCTMAAIYFSKTARFARPRMTMFGEEAVNRTTTIFAGLGPDQGA
jgi:hypothetical protein